MPPGGFRQAGPGYCPSKAEQEAIGAAWANYDDPANRRVAQESARVESEGYCRWTRVEGIRQFAKKMGFRKIGIATCIGFVDQAHTLSGILEGHGFEVASAACKNGGVAKEDIGLADDEEIRPGGHESMCNPVSQAELLNRSGCEFNIVLGLCVGHDSLKRGCVGQRRQAAVLPDVVASRADLPSGQARRRGVTGQVFHRGARRSVFPTLPRSRGLSVDSGQLPHCDRHRGAARRATLPAPRGWG